MNYSFFNEIWEVNRNNGDILRFNEWHQSIINEFKATYDFLEKIFNINPNSSLQLNGKAFTKDFDGGQIIITKDNLKIIHKYFKITVNHYLMKINFEITNQYELFSYNPNDINSNLCQEKSNQELGIEQDKKILISLENDRRRRTKRGLSLLETIRLIALIQKGLSYDIIDENIINYTSEYHKKERENKETINIIKIFINNSFIILKIVNFNF